VSKAQFEKDGYTVLPMFDPALVRAAEADIAEHIDRLSHALYLPFEKSCPDAPIGQRLERIWKSDRSQANLLRIALCTDAHRGPRLRALAEAAHLVDTAECLTGMPLEGQVVRVRASIGVFPEHKHGWHSDVSTDDGTHCGRVQITAWLPLSDAGANSGGLELIPGRREAPLHHGGAQEHIIDESQLDRLPRVRPHCPAGHALFLDRFTPHRTLPAGPSARFALVIWMKATTRRSARMRTGAREAA